MQPLKNEGKNAQTENLNELSEKMRAIATERSALNMRNNLFATKQVGQNA